MQGTLARAPQWGAFALKKSPERPLLEAGPAQADRHLMPIDSNPLSCHGTRFVALVGLVCALGQSAFAAEASLQDLQAQNRELRTLLETQQRQLDEFRVQMNRMAGNPEAASTPARESSRGDRKLILSGEVGVAFYSSGADGRYPKHEFRVDDANLHLEGVVAKNTYFFGELQLSKQEA